MAIADPITPGEIWYPIPGCPGYELSSDFRVRSYRLPGSNEALYSRKPKFIKVEKMKHGHLRFGVSVDKKRKTMMVHRVIYEIIFGSIPHGLFVCHYDDNSENNYPSNLRCGTVMDNARDRMRNKGYQRGEANPISKLSTGEVRIIKQRLRDKSQSMRSMAVEFGVSYPSIVQIRNEKSWKHVTI